MKGVIQMAKTLKSMMIVLALVFALTASASAVGTPAGTFINNTATLTYNDANGNAMPMVTSNTVTTVVSQVAGVDVSPATSSEVGFASAQLVFPTIIRNTGNGTDSYALALSGVPAGWTAVIYRDDNGDGILQPGETTIVSNTGSLGHETEYKVLVKITVPSSVADGAVANVTLTATSAFNSGVYDTSVMTVTINQAVVDVVKVASITDPKPGDEITYTITWENTGSADAHELVITDPINMNLTYVAGSMVYDGDTTDMNPGVVLTDAADLDNGDYGFTTAGTVTVFVGSVPAGAKGSLVIRVTVNSDILAGVSISNIAYGTYKDPDDNVLVMDSDPSVVTIAVKAGVDVNIPAGTLNVTPGDTIQIPFSVTNTGNAPDVVDITYTSTILTYEIWIDFDGNGIIDNGDVMATDTDGDGYPDTGIIQPGQTLYFIAKAVVPVGTADLASDLLTLTGKSSNDTAISDSDSISVIVHAPRLSMEKSVSPTGPQNPGTVLTYTLVITNSGTGAAKDLLITDPIPTFTTYIEDSITVNGIGRTDEIDGDAARFVANSVLVSWVQLAGNGATLTITFQVRID